MLSLPCTFLLLGVSEGVSVSLLDKIIEPTKDYINFKDLLIHLSGLNEQPAYEVVTYLLHHDLSDIGFYYIDTDYKIIQADFDDKSITNFLSSIQQSLLFGAEAWIFHNEKSLEELSDAFKPNITKTCYDNIHSFFKLSDLLSFEPIKDLLHFDYKDTRSININSSLTNNSLASYLPEYTLPQVVALILNIDLSDITTSQSNSYINDQSEYPDNYYHKFQNTLQSYSASARNHQPEGINLVIYTEESYSSSPKSYVNLEETNISREKLSNYLSKIGYSLDDLIAKQERLYYISEDYEVDEQVIDYKKRIEELEQQLENEKPEISKRLYTTPAMQIMNKVITQFWINYDPSQPAPKQSTITKWITDNFDNISPALALNIDKVCRHSDARSGGKYKR